MIIEYWNVGTSKSIFCNMDKVVIVSKSAAYTRNPYEVSHYSIVTTIFPVT